MRSVFFLKRYNELMGIDEKPLKIDRTRVVISSLEEPTDEKAYWLNKSPAERMAAIETMRQILYGYDQSSSRLQRVFTITERS